MPMTATGVRGVLIIGTKDIADPESPPPVAYWFEQNHPPLTAMVELRCGLPYRWVATRRLSGCLPRRQYSGVCVTLKFSPRSAASRRLRLIGHAVSCMQMLAKHYRTATVSASTIWMGLELTETLWSLGEWNSLTPALPKAVLYQTELRPLIATGRG